MDSVINELHALISQKKIQLTDLLREKEILRSQSEVELRNIYNTVKKLKSIIARNDFEKQIMKKEIDELNEFIRKHGCSEVYLMKVEEEIKSRCESEDAEYCKLKEKEKRLREKVGKLRQEIREERDDVGEGRRRVEELRMEKKEVKKKIGEVREKAGERREWILARHQRRGEIKELKFSSGKYPSYKMAR